MQTPPRNLLVPLLLSVLQPTIAFSSTQAIPIRCKRLVLLSTPLRFQHKLAKAPPRYQFSNTIKTMSAAAPLQWMELHSDKSKTELVRTSEQDWLVTSQSSGTARKPIERLGGDLARATSVVKFEPNKGFPRHTHTGGEEFFVVKGTWIDDYGSFPKYSYLRNYINSSHQPEMGPDGVEIFVKLFQMSHTNLEPETTAVNAAPDADGWTESDAVRSKVLYESALEKVSAVMLPAGYQGAIGVPEQGKEILVVDGAFSSPLGEHDAMAWCRLVRGNGPVGETLADVRSDAGCYLYVKENHLASDEVGFPAERMREFVERRRLEEEAKRAGAAGDSS